MKLLFAFLIVAVFQTNSSFAQDYFSDKYQLSEDQMIYIKDRVPEMRIYFIKDKNVIVSHAGSKLGLLVDNKKYKFKLQNDPEGGKFQVLNTKDEIVGYALWKNEIDHDVEIHFSNEELIRKMGLKELFFSNKNEMKIVKR